MGYQINHDFPHLGPTHVARAWNVRNRSTHVDIHENGRVDFLVVSTGMSIADL